MEKLWALNDSMPPVWTGYGEVDNMGLGSCKGGANSDVSKEHERLRTLQRWHRYGPAKGPSSSSHLVLCFLHDEQAWLVLGLLDWFLPEPATPSVCLSDSAVRFMVVCEQRCRPC